jgi:hypothetical protein
MSLQAHKSSRDFVLSGAFEGTDKTKSQIASKLRAFVKPLVHHGAAGPAYPLRDMPPYDRASPIFFPVMQCYL